MADNVNYQSATPATPAANTVVSTEEVTTLNGASVSAQHVQRAAIALRTGDGIAIDLPGDSTNGLDIDVTRVQGTVQALGSIQTVGTSQVLGSVQGVGTFQVLGSVQPLAGSVHVANTAAVLGSVSAQGYVAHGAVVAGNPVLTGAFGTSGTQVAVSDGQLVRLWADLNGRLQVRGTIDSIPSITVSAMPTVTITGTVQTHGTSQALGSVQTVGTSQVLGSVQLVGTNQALGSVQLVGTNQALGTLSVAGHAAPGGVNTNPIQTGGRTTHARPGTQAVGSAVAAWYDLHGRQVVQVGAGTTEPLGTAFVASGNGTVITGRGAGSYMRLFDIVISGSAAGTVRLLEDGTQRWGPLFIAANGGWNMNSAVGVKLPTANTSLVASHSLGTMSITINYAVEGA